MIWPAADGGVSVEGDFVPVDSIQKWSTTLYSSPLRSMRHPLPNNRCSSQRSVAAEAGGRAGVPAVLPSAIAAGAVYTSSSVGLPSA